MYQINKERERKYVQTLSAHILQIFLQILGGLVFSVLATGPKVRGFDPDRGRWIFKGDKNPEHRFLRRGSKAVVDLRHVKEPYGMNS
jgi:hypothetical protein